MILPDANLLLYAYDQSSPFHLKAAVWCEKIMSSSSPVILLPVVVFGFVRISTHPRIFTDPLSVAEASSHVRSWLGRKQVRLHDMLPEDVETALALLESAGTAGNLTTDAQIAAVALRLDAEVHTADLDFGRFAGVRFNNPLV
ncbi:MAG: TA system VapC family ribonuclease toxin [Luteolibacter sp.]